MPDEQPQMCIEHGERLSRIETSLEHLEAKVDQLVAEMRAGFRDVHDTLDRHYVRREEYEPIRKIVYGLTGIMLAGVVVAIIELVIKRHAGG